MDCHRFCKPVFSIASVFALVLLAGCSINPYTGQKDFTGLMSPQQEASIGASQHAEIVKQYGGEYKNTAVQNYVNEIGQNMAQYSERQDVSYKFTVLDSPVVNAFALPGGYVYVTRGTLAVANSEAELAGVLGHEVAHVSARHQAARYSQGVLTQLGATVLSSAIGMPAASQAIGIGSNLYMSSYSREQETQADMLGIRYLAKGGYDTHAMSYFLKNMELYNSVQAQIEGKPQQQYNYFSSHPHTEGRVVTAQAESDKYAQSGGAGKLNHDRYISMMRGLAYGDDPAQGFVKNNTFYHPQIGFAFAVPSGFKVDNQPERIAVEGREGTVFVLDIAKASGASRAGEYIGGVWLNGKAPSSAIEPINVNGLAAATTAVGTTVQNVPAQVRLVAIEWDNNQFVRMQMLLPTGAAASAIDDMKRMSYSFRRMNSSDQRMAKPYQIDVVKAGAGDTIQSLAAQMNVDKAQVEQFAALNGLTPADRIETGRMYKLIK